MNSILFLIPVKPKYWIGEKLRNYRLPYKIIQNGWVVVQIGAPWDLLKAGRSRSIHFSRKVGNNGTVVVVEADENNVAALQKFISKNSINNIIVVKKAAWSKDTTLRFLIDDDHPASNLVEEVFDEQRNDKGKYREVMVEADSIDNILEKHGIKEVDLLSVTSNGSEDEILKGIERMHSAVKYISIVGSPENFQTIFKYGYKRVSDDDRGALYQHENVQ